MFQDITYAHEHITIDLSGPKQDPDASLKDENTATEEFSALATLGVTTIVDQTGRGMGRDPLYAQKVCDTVGIRLLHSTGYYKEPFLPEECYKLSEKELAAIMIDELENGISDTGIKAHHIGEIGTSKDAITPMEEKVLRAAIGAHLETGASLCTHLTLGRLAKEQLKILKDMNATLSHVVLSHIDLAGDMDYVREVLDSGVNIAFDTIGKLSYMPDTSRAQWLAELCKQGYTDQIVMSVDITRQSHYKINGGIGYAYLLESFVPMALEAGCSQQDLSQILTDNPKRIYQL